MITQKAIEWEGKRAGMRKQITHNPFLLQASPAGSDSMWVKSSSEGWHDILLEFSPWKTESVYYLIVIGK